MQRLKLFSAVFAVTALHLLCPVSQAAINHRDRDQNRPLVADPGKVQATPGVPRSSHAAVSGKTLKAICDSASWDYEVAPCGLLDAADLNPSDARIRHLASSAEGFGKAQRTELTEWVERQRARTEGLQQEARAREAQARRALDRAQAAAQLADAAKDVEAKTIAGAAVRIASQALARTQ
jgi:hypothetical protein